jgi:hypothetical protein
MPELQLHHVQLARVAREALDVGDVRTAARAHRALQCACDGSVGAGEPPAVTAGTLPQLLFALDAESRGFRWSARTVEWADGSAHPEDNRRTLTNAREAAQSNVLELVRASRDALREGDTERAIELYRRALRRWAHFEGQVARLNREAGRATRSSAERWTDYTEELPGRIREAATPDSPFTLPLVIAGLLALLFLR